MPETPPAAGSPPDGGPEPSGPAARWGALLRDLGLLAEDAGDPPAGMEPLEWSRGLGIEGDAETRAFAAFLEAPFRDTPPDGLPLAEFLDRVPIAFARRFGVLACGDACPVDRPPPSPASVVTLVDRRPVIRPLSPDGVPAETKDGKKPPRPLKATLALGSVAAWEVADSIGRFLGRDWEPLFLPAETVRAAIDDAYEARGATSAAAAELADEDADLEAAVRSLGDGAGREDLLDGADRAPVVRL
ncbi:MAG: hypothetical protein AAF907_12245, partial [Planctomycetota bacterium]